MDQLKGREIVVTCISHVRNAINLAYYDRPRPTRPFHYSLSKNACRCCQISFLYRLAALNVVMAGINAGEDRTEGWSYVCCECRLTAWSFGCQAMHVRQSAAAQAD